MRALPFALLTIALAGCQTYDFEPVSPLAIAQTTQTKSVAAKNKKPDLMMLIDTSGSMAAPLNPGDANCRVGGNVCSGAGCPANCPTRISDLKRSMGTFLMGNPSVARVGMTVYPVDPVCGPSNKIIVELSQSNDVDSELAKTSDDVNKAIQNLAVQGGTPTGDSLRFLANYSPLANPDREDFVLLLTDGLPNCNQAQVAVANSCACTDSRSPCSYTPPSSSTTYSLCLDKDGSVAAVGELRKKNIKTIVVGFGADTAVGAGPDTLNAMAEAGGFARACPMQTDAECGSNNTCDKASKLCVRKFYQASNAAELAKALQDIIDIVKGVDLCTYTLDAVPDDPAFLAVIYNGQSLAQSDSTWKYAAGKVTFQGQYCDQIKTATQDNKVQLEFRIVNTL